MDRASITPRREKNALSGHSSLVVWRFYDGKPGHDRQSVGLLQALAAAAPVDAYAFDAREHPVSASQYLARSLHLGADAPDPDLIIGAGRRCQWPMLAARRARGGHTIYLMKPYFPMRCFDRCLVPRHDRPTENARVIATEGVLNDVLVSAELGSDGLLLVGGPSGHYAWDEESLLDQIHSIVERTPGKKWVIADSRRTPPETSAALRQFARDQVTLMPSHRSTPDWLTSQLARSDVVWVSSDSVSMIYEALTAGAAVGVLEVPARGDDRISRIVRDLAARNMVTPYAHWRDGAALEARPALAEAARCAGLILAHWDPTARALRDRKAG